MKFLKTAAVSAIIAEISAFLFMFLIALMSLRLQNIEPLLKIGAFSAWLLGGLVSGILALRFKSDHPVFSALLSSLLFCALSFLVSLFGKGEFQVWKLICCPVLSVGAALLVGASAMKMRHKRKGSIKRRGTVKRKKKKAHF